MPAIAKYGKHVNLVNIHSEIAGNGDVASYNMQYTGGINFKVAISLAEIGMAMNELKWTARRMVGARAAWPDRGKSALMETADNAMVPSKLDVILDPHSGNRTIVVQTADNAPIAIRLTPFEAEILLERLLLLKRLGNS